MLKKKIAAALALTLSISMLAGCSSKEEEEVTETPVVTEDVQEQVQPEVKEEKTGIQEEKIGSVSFAYDADTLDIIKEEDEDSFMVSVFNKKEPSIVPQINMLGIDTRDLNGKITEAEYADLCKGLLQQYYTEAQESMDVTVLQLVQDSPSGCLAEALIHNDGTENYPAIDAKMKLTYNQDHGVMTIFMMETDMEPEAQKPFLMTYDSVVLH